jgi:hypothetical protein
MPRGCGIDRSINGWPLVGILVELAASTVIDLDIFHTG